MNAYAQKKDSASKRRDDDANYEPGERTARTGDYRAQAAALSPANQPGYAVQCAANAPVQMKAEAAPAVEPKKDGGEAKPKEAEKDPSALEALRSASTVTQDFNLEMSEKVGANKVKLSAGGKLTITDAGVKFKLSPLSFKITNAEDQSLNLDFSLDPDNPSMEVGFKDPAFGLSYKVEKDGKQTVNAYFDIIHMLYGGAIKTVKKSLKESGLTLEITSKFGMEAVILDGDIRIDNIYTKLGIEAGEVYETDSGSKYGVAAGAEMDIKQTYPSGVTNARDRETEGSASVYGEAYMGNTKARVEAKDEAKQSGDYRDGPKQEQTVRTQALAEAYGQAYPQLDAFRQEKGPKSAARDSVQYFFWSRYESLFENSVAKQHGYGLKRKKEQGNVYGRSSFSSNFSDVGPQVIAADASAQQVHEFILGRTN